MLKETLFKFFKLDGLIDSFVGFIEAKVELVKMEIREDLARGIAKALVYVSLTLMSFLFVILLSMGLAFYLGTLFQGPHTGFFIVGGFYFLAFLLIVLFRKQIEAAFEKRFVEIIKLKGK